MLLLAITVSASVQVVGVLLIFALLILPAAAAQQFTAAAESRDSARGGPGGARTSGSG